ncbi:MAG: MopE-related protein [Patescibacteria group bacterium]
MKKSEKYLGFDWDDKKKRKSFLWEVGWQWGLILCMFVFLIIYTSCGGGEKSGVDNSIGYDAQDQDVQNGNDISIDRGNDVNVDVDSGNNNKDFTGVDSLDFGKEDKMLPDIFDAFDIADIVADIFCVPSGSEICDGKDNDCDGETDEEWGAPPKGFVCKNLGVCQGIVPVCKAGQWTCIYSNEYELEEKTCDNKDNDCDGEIDEEIENCCQPGEKKLCGTDVGECGFGEKTCDENGKWGECLGGVKPSPEVCDEKDNDCDGKIDNNAQGCAVYYADKDADGFGVLDDFLCLCQSAPPYVIEKVTQEDCNDNNGLFYPGAQPYCKNGCSDGIFDEGEECDDGNLIADDGCDMCASFLYYPMVTYSFPTKELPPAKPSGPYGLDGGPKNIRLINYQDGEARYALVWRKQVEGEYTISLPLFIPTFFLVSLDENLKPLPGKLGVKFQFQGSEETNRCRSFDVKFIDGKIYIAWRKEICKPNLGCENSVVIDVFDENKKQIGKYLVNINNPFSGFGLGSIEIFPLANSQLLVRWEWDADGPPSVIWEQEAVIINLTNGKVIKEFSLAKILEAIGFYPLHLLVLPSFDGKNIIHLWDEGDMDDEEKAQWHALWYDVENQSEISNVVFKGMDGVDHGMFLPGYNTKFTRQGNYLVQLLQDKETNDIFAEIYDQNAAVVKPKTKILLAEENDFPSMLCIFIAPLTHPENKLLIGWISDETNTFYVQRFNFATGAAKKFSFPLVGEAGKVVARALVILDENTAVLQQYPVDSYEVSFTMFKF